MQLTKFTHSCVRVESQDVVIVIDPGNFSEVETAMQGADHVLITHTHPDHLDPERVPQQLRSQPDTQVWAPAIVARDLRETLGEAAQDSKGQQRIHDVEPDSQLDLDGVPVQTFGGQHALIHPLIRTVENVGYLLEGKLFHPGDSFVVPHGISPTTVLVPLHAPWSKMSEVIDFLIAVGAPTAYQIHDALLSQNGFGIVEKQVKNFAGKYGTDYIHLEPGTTVQV
ncbi:MBL fold metallo-hydrolase [Kocuria sp. ZOR0020]|uniref:MBL fold metallo-hydrolase n=1 Tax=Kocuria sp. ZOR0020 TaxID=1339234 RepID=UPI000647BD68|nr:MBL fold metallo-hydrolase [Kocuria sp. ZOR0020]